MTLVFLLKIQTVGLSPGNTELTLRPTGVVTHRSPPWPPDVGTWADRSAVPVQKMGEGAVLESQSFCRHLLRVPIRLPSQHSRMLILLPKWPMAEASYQAWWQKPVPSRAAAPPASYNNRY